MPTPPASATPDRWLVLTALVAVACFTAAEIYAQHQARVIDALAADIAANAAPSIEHLAAARRDMRLWHTAANRAVFALARKRPFDPGTLKQADQRLHQDLSAYLELPFFPGERALYQSVDESVDELGRSIGHVMNRIDDAHDLEGARLLARNELAPVAERADAAMEKLLDFDAEHISASAAQISQWRVRNRHASYAVHALASGIALLLMVFAVRAARAHARTLESRNRLAEVRAQELEHFARQVAHDLKNPLGSMALRLVLGQRQAGGDEVMLNMLGKLSQSITHMNRMVDGLLDFALSAGQPRPEASGDVLHVAESVVALQRVDAEQVGATIVVEPGAALRVACPEGALTSVLANLVGNAIKYIADGRTPVREIRVRVRDAGGQRVRVEVEDTGPGIPAGEEQAVFEPFLRIRGTSVHPGLGLGLATVRRLVTAYGGEVGVESVHGRGSCFWFELPRALPR